MASITFKDVLLTEFGARLVPSTETKLLRNRKRMDTQAVLNFPKLITEA
ncbi:MAG: hypothetical protein LBJ00_18615 [Planctomycetaceae bacterium]|nr:hypothetical protein [Planctomycetaceae bacterium]